MPPNDAAHFTLSISGNAHIFEVSDHCACSNSLILRKRTHENVHAYNLAMITMRVLGFGALSYQRHFALTGTRLETRWHGNVNRYGRKNFLYFGNSNVFDFGLVFWLFIEPYCMNQVNHFDTYEMPLIRPVTRGSRGDAPWLRSSPPWQIFFYRKNNL